ncbi:MAG TPA: DUF3290 domain-containing protein [Candidatus Tetragenococcus pullicola]|nr:DUF3290 domain-containing protein [Candidatus Tetragenococcus pullicola]
MDFYGFEYINQQSNINDYIKYAIIFLALVLFVLLFALYRKNHFQTKYRDLSILFFLILLFMLGIEWTDYQQNQSNYAQMSQMTNFMKGVARDHGLKEKDILVNATQLKEGVIVKFENRYYSVHLSEDQQSYELSPVYLMDDNIHIVE